METQLNTSLGEVMSVVSTVIAILPAPSHPLNDRADDLKRLKGVYSLNGPSALLYLIIMLQSTSTHS
jgi:hypothetical protein